MPRSIPSIESRIASEDDVDKASSVVPYLNQADSAGTTSGVAMTNAVLPTVHLPPITLHRGSGLAEDPLLSYAGRDAHNGGKLPLGGHTAVPILKDETEESPPDDKSTKRPSTAGSDKAMLKRTKPSGGGFGVTPEDLSRLVNFDRREGEPLRAQLVMMGQLPFEGLQGVAQRLQTDLHKGLDIASDAIPTLGRKSLSTGLLAASGPDETLSDDSDLLDVIDAKERRETFGTNVVPPPPSDTILEIVWGTIKEDTIIKILIAGAIVTLAVGLATEPKDGWIEGVAILSAVLIVLTVTAGNDYSKDKKFKKLLLLNSDKKTKIIRGGRRDQISSWDVLTGDLVELAIGDEIPADGILVRGNRLVVDESPLTGESLPVKKSEKAPFMFSGCQVSEGSGEMLVTSVGPRSTGGKIQELLSETQKQDTPLQLELKDVAVLVGKIGFTAGIGTFIALMIQWFVHLGLDSWEWSKLYSIVHFFVIGVTVVVVAVPEGLPLAVTISLAFSMLKMIKERCFVRHLDASETMGQATCICTDKTGTLTENRMTVVKVMTASQMYDGEGAGSGNDRIFTADTMDRRMRDLLCESICMNSTCFIKKAGGKVSFIGSPTEGALLLFSEKLGVDYQTLRDEITQMPEGTIGFSSGRKRMVTTVRPKAATPGDITEYRLYVKGASEIVLDLCTHGILTADPYEVQPLNPTDVNKIQNAIKSWAAEGLRTIVTAYRNMNTCGTDDDPDQNLVFVGLMGIKDPVRKEVPQAVAQCQTAGIVVRMVTGDNILTASKIARECHILDNSGIAMEGPVFRTMTDAERLAVIPRLQVLARSSPEDKLILVNTLKNMGEVVAVTGDGTNDAPALKEANVGFAMGISGTQIAMNACDIILLDDNFATIVSAIRWGRNVLNCVRKFLQFQLAVNLTAIAVTFIGSLTTGESPLSAVQLLWVNLIMDTLGALALASDEPDDDILLKAPHGRHEKMITRPMTQYIVAQTIFQVAALLIVLYTGDLFIPMDTTRYTTDALRAQRIETLVFTCFVFLQISNEVMARNLNHQLNMFKGVFRNPLFAMILVLILIVQCCMVQFAQAFAGTVALVWPEWIACALVGLANFVWMFFVRLGVKVYRRHVAIRNHRIHVAGSLKELESGTIGAGGGKEHVMKSSI